MKILILGGTRFIGPHVVRGLINAGCDVTIFHRGETEVELPSSVKHVHGDFAKFSEYIEQLRVLAPEVVVDMVPFREEDAQRLKMFKGLARRFVAISSQDVYRAFGRIFRTEPGPPDAVPLTEDSPLRQQLSVAGLEYNKTAIERELLADRDMRVTILRLPATHGPGDSQHRLFEYVKRMDDGRPAILLDQTRARWRWARGYVEDVAHAIMLAVTNERSAGRIYNVAYPVSFSEAEWVRQIARIHGWQGRVFDVLADRVPLKLKNSQLDLTQQYDVSSSRIRRELGYKEAIDFDDALRRTIDWERANPPEKIDPELFDYSAEDEVISNFASN